MMSHLALLELACDRIPPRVREAALALDLEEARTRPRTTARTRTNVVRLKPKGQIECMAEALVSIRRRRGVATDQDLQRRGFARDLIQLYGNQAVARAEEIWRERTVRQ